MRCSTYWFHPKKLFALLASINILLIGFHLLLQYLFIETDLSEHVSALALRFNMDAETSVPTWFAVVMLFVVAQLLLAIGLKWKKKGKGYWYALSGIALYLSIDEASEIHELLIDPMQELFGISSGLLFFAWMIPVALLLLVLVFVFWKFYWRLDRTTKQLLAFAAIVYVSGAIGVEMISGAYWESQNFVYDFNYRVLNAFEEGMENFGIIIAICALVRQLTSK